MMKRSSGFTGFARALVGVAAGVAIWTFEPAADAHFILQAPASWMSEDALGSPQKLGPCGNETGGTPTGTVTPFAAGQTITITVTETIYHPGHYRVALAVNDQSELPPEPLVTAGTQACGTAEVEDPPVYPVLADGVLDHTAPFDGPQSIQVTLPKDVTCANCTLQIIEFMSDHGLNNPGGCFYHHCANISITDGPLPDGGDVPASGGSGVNPGETDTSGGCGCTVPGRGASGTGFAGILLMLTAFVTCARRHRR